MLLVSEPGAPQAEMPFSPHMETVLQLQSDPSRCAVGQGRHQKVVIAPSAPANMSTKSLVFSEPIRFSGTFQTLLSAYP